MDALEKFVSEAVNSGNVWGLIKDDNWAVSPSNDYENLEVLIFWSDKALAEKCAVDEWKDYQAESISTNEWVENWAAGMFNEQIVAGTNWNAELEGEEHDPLELALALMHYMKEHNKTFKPVNFNHFDELEKEYQSAVDEIEGIE
jgi:hypothetical protein